MDTSETYIKMMESAWLDIKDNLPIGVLIFSRRQRMRYVLDGEIVDYRDAITTGNCERAFPLLEQDQLQEMLGWDRNPIGYVEPLYRYITNDVCQMAEGIEEQMLRIGDSMEQLWLSFVMKENFNETWDGEKWL